MDPEAKAAVKTLGCSHYSFEAYTVAASSTTEGGDTIVHAILEEFLHILVDDKEAP